MATLRLSVNGHEHTVEGVEPLTPLLWVLRDSLGLVGTKFGCGGGFCGACTVHLDGRPVRSCSILATSAAGREITTIEGLAGDDGTLHPLQEAWIEHDVPQCGYCQAGQLMSAASLLERNPRPSASEIDAAMTGLCRCGTYNRILQAINSAVQKMSNTSTREEGGA